MIRERLNALKTLMRQQNIDVYYLNTSDYHLSEYVPEYFKTVAWFSGFTGSLATLLVTLNDTYIFVDGRYYLQADQQCLPYGIKVVKLGTEGALEPLAFLKENYPGAIVGLDGKRTSIAFAKELLNQGNQIRSIDIYSSLIQNRTPLSHSKIFEMDNSYAGLSRIRKVKLITHCLRDMVHIVDNLESIAYLLNLRGNDIAYTPVFLSYMVLQDGDVYLFCDLDRFNADLLDKLYADGIIIRPYDSYYDFLKTIEKRKIVLDERKVNYESYLALSQGNNLFYDRRSIIEDMKAIKNPIEQDNIRRAHIYDGIAVLRFMMWLDSIDKRTVNECDCSRKINSLRMEVGAKDLSFASIVAYNENAAIVHYFPEEDKCARLDNRGILLFDTGGQYLEGTTDITRTVALGEVDEEVRSYFTLVLKSMLALSELKFLSGLCGKQIDIVARQELWAYSVDYRHGTGHGVGNYLAVHEGPPNIRYGSTETKNEEVELKPGMVFSDEPGVYFANRFGIRCENLLLCKKVEENEYGRFLGFETLTMVPFDLKLIDRDLLDEKSIRALNSYHQKVYDTLSPFITEEERAYLKEKTQAI
ncbi:MAG: aminopeptidase P family protein [Erysipelotrichaceae bacterium]|nr:aminopeptidase P family protein [Erysipelotrichaceae bacterium]